MASEPLSPSLTRDRTDHTLRTLNPRVDHADTRVIMTPRSFVARRRILNTPGSKGGKGSSKSTIQQQQSRAISSSSSDDSSRPGDRMSEQEAQEAELDRMLIGEHEVNQSNRNERNSTRPEQSNNGQQINEQSSSSFDSATSCTRPREGAVDDGLFCRSLRGRGHRCNEFPRPWHSA